MSELLKPGAVVSARYRIDAVDAPAREYLGVDLSSGEPVLLVQLGRAEAEAIRPAVGLSGPDLLELLGLEELAGHPLAICRVAKGASLSDAVSEQGLLDPVTAIQALLPIFTTVSYLHRASAVHGSIAPETIRLDPRPRLAFHPGRPGPSAFRSPERNDGGACSARDDAWALSACLYYALVGEPPARSGIGAPDELIIAGISDQRLRAALFQGLATARVQRAASAEPLRAALREWWATVAEEQVMAATERGPEADELWGEGEVNSPTLDASALAGSLGGSLSASRGEAPGRWEPGGTLESPIYHTPAMPVVAPRAVRPQMMSAPGIALELETTDVQSVSPPAVRAPAVRAPSVRPPAAPAAPAPSGPNRSGAVTSSAGAPPRPPRPARPTVTAVSPVLPRLPRPARPTVTAVSPVLPSVNKTMQSPKAPSVRPAPPSVRPPPPSVRPPPPSVRPPAPPLSQRSVPSEAVASTVRAPSERPPNPVELRSPSSHPPSARPLPPPSVFPSPLQAQAPALSRPLPPPPRLPGAPPPSVRPLGAVGGALGAPPPLLSASASESQLDELLGAPLVPALPQVLTGGPRAASTSESQLDDLLSEVSEDDASEALLASLESPAEAPPGLGQTQLMEPARSVEPTLESPAYEAPAAGAVSPFGRTLMMEPAPPLEGVRGLGTALPGDVEAIGALGGAAPGGAEYAGAPLSGAEYGVGALSGAAPPRRTSVGLLVGAGLATFTVLGLLTWGVVAVLGRSAEPTVVAVGPAGSAAPGAQPAHGAQELEADSKGGAVQPPNPQAAAASERANDAEEPAVAQAPAAAEAPAAAAQPSPAATAAAPPSPAAAAQPAPAAAAADSQSVRERRAMATAEDKSVGHCVSRWMPEGTFQQGPNLNWMCGQSDARVGAIELKKAVVRGSGGTVTAAMRTTSRLGWYEMAAYTTLRSTCCSAAPPITLPEPAAHCEALAPLITKLADTVLSAEAYEPALTAFISAASCESAAGRAGAYWMKRAPTGTERNAFESWVRALRR